MSRVRKVESYRQELSQIKNEAMRNCQTAMQAQEYELALQAIRLMQKQLGQVKKEINQDLKEIRLYYREKSQSARSTAGFIGRLFGQSNASRGRAGRNVQSEKEAHVRPYEELKLFIDQSIVELDEIKLNIQRRIST